MNYLVIEPTRITYLGGSHILYRSYIKRGPNLREVRRSVALDAGQGQCKSGTVVARPNRSLEVTLKQPGDIIGLVKSMRALFKGGV